VATLDDEAIARRIVADKIHVLVNCFGHTGRESK
jgi:predicted O-linked N-acetylglucosamine transferase (SPINDLY family)